MAREVTRAELRTSARQLTDTEGDDHVTDTELNVLINSARKQVHEILRKEDPDFYEKTASVVTTGGDTYALPTDHHLTKAVEWFSYGGEYVALRRTGFSERLTYQIPGGAAGVNAEAFRLVGGNLVLYPKPPANQTYRHIYVPAATLLTADADTVDGREAELIALRVALRIAPKQGDADLMAMLKALYDEELARVKADAEDRAINNTQVIEDVENFSDDVIRLPMPRRI